MDVQIVSIVSGRAAASSFSAEGVITAGFAVWRIARCLAAMVMSAKLLFWVVIHHIDLGQIDFIIFEDIGA